MRGKVCRKVLPFSAARVRLYLFCTSPNRKGDMVLKRHEDLPQAHSERSQTAPHSTSHHYKSTSHANMTIVHRDTHSLQARQAVSPLLA